MKGVEALTIFRLPRMNRQEIEELIEGQFLCRIAFKGEKYPYMAPFQYVYHNGSLYFHFTDYGKKMKLLGKDKHVCVEIEKYQPDLREYNFVVLRGALRVVEGRERAEAIGRMAEYGRERLSENFLAAHGFARDEDWSSFTPEKPLVIVKLENVVQEIGLKSP
ncbi:MAG: pyridoxamine 5'-phosphate oxidase family protein [Candidatus Bathyarchaeota archaeon]|nr:MAG: pyridoxamine 5'-phosphate oxidase family protein [Candidatus Bathyarchaeota archaeon]